MSKLEAFFRECPVPNEPLSIEDHTAMMNLLASDLDEPIGYAEFMVHPLVVGTFKTKEDIPASLMAVWQRQPILNGHFKMSMAASLFLSLMIKSFGDAMTYFSYCAYRAHRIGERVITLDFLVKKVFDSGIFSEDQLTIMRELRKDNKNILNDTMEWKRFIHGEGAEGKLTVRFSDDDERLMDPSAITTMEPREIDGRMFFWMGKRYVSVSMEDFNKLETTEK